MQVVRTRTTAPVITRASRGWIVGMLAWAALASAGETRDTMLEATLCDASSVPAPLARKIAGEATAVWREAGVALNIVARPVGCGAPAAAGAAHVIVRIERAKRLEYRDARRTVASIAFRGGSPVPVITLSLHAARWLMENDPATRWLLPNATARIADEWTGRMLGRALAHEIGHYLLRSSGHAPSGLMRATHTVQAFVGQDRSGFYLTSVERCVLLAAEAMPAVAELASAKD